MSSHRPRRHMTIDNVRVCYRSGHGWYIQAATPNSDGLIKGSRTVDPWENKSRAYETMGEARTEMYRRFPVLDSNGRAITPEGE